MTNTASRLTRNSFFLYMRMVILMILSLYTSRVVLNALGVEDYGVMSLVGSITAMFLSLRTVFAESIQRFLNYEKGRGDIDAETEVFSIGVLLHIIIAFAFCLLIGTVGLWYLNNNAVIPDDRMSAARVVFLCNIVSSAFTILIIPYDAVVIANEKMDVYAWVSIADGVLRLSAALLLTIISYDSLVVLAILTTLIPVLNFAFYYFYCLRFPECKYKRVRSKERLKQIFSFAGWSFGGNLSYTLTHEGLNLILNSFGGVVANAARNIAYQVRSAVNQISNNTILATKPYIVQSSVTMSDETIWEKIILISRLSFSIMVVTALPIVVYCGYLLHVWLVTVPEEAVLYTQLIIVSTVLRSLHGPLDLFYMAKGQIKRMVIIESLLLILLLPVAFLGLQLGLGLYSVFIMLCVWEVVIVVALTINAAQEFGVSASKFIRGVILPSVLSALIASVVGFIFYKYLLFCSLIPVLLAMLFMVLLLSGLLYFLLFQTEEKRIIKGLVSSLIHPKLN